MTGRNDKQNNSRKNFTREDPGETGSETSRPTMLWCRRRLFLSQIALEGS